MEARSTLDASAGLPEKELTALIGQETWWVPAQVSTL
jgi:hypothetical protein